MSPQHTRRVFLAGVSVSSLGLAGCTSRGDVRELTGPTFDSLVSDITVGSQDVVVELASSDVTEVVLVAPDGTAFDSQKVQTGVNTVRFQIIELDLELASSSHYTPGTYEIVVVANDTEFRKELLIAPDIRLTSVRQYRDGESPSDLARIVFTVENAGNGPTWIYDASFQDAPNFAANTDLSENPSIPYVSLPTMESEFVVAQYDTQSYITVAKPLAFTETEPICEQNTRSFNMSIGITGSSPIEILLDMTCGGKERALNFTDDTVYTRVKIEWESAESSQ